MSLNFYLVRTHEHQCHDSMEEIVTARNAKSAARIFSDVKREQDPSQPPIDVAYVFRLVAPERGSEGVVYEPTQTPEAVRLLKARQPGVDFDP